MSAAAVRVSLVKVHDGHPTFGGFCALCRVPYKSTAAGTRSLAGVHWFFVNLVKADPADRSTVAERLAVADGVVAALVAGGAS